MDTGVSQSAPNPNRWKILRITLLMTIMCSLDMNVVNVALPSMSVVLNVPISMITWIVTGYLITICALLLFFGRLGDIKGNTLIFKFGIVVFTIGSLLCGISLFGIPVNITTLIIARVIQAVGATAAMANNQGIITRAFPSNERGRALGFTGTSVAIGTLAGPPLGGVIVHYLSWQYIFLINIPIGVFMFLYGRRILPKGEGRAESLDIKGTVLFALSSILIFCAIGGGESIRFSNPLAITAVAAGLVLLCVFILVERRQSQPMLDLSIFKNPLFTISMVCALLVYASLCGHNILQPFYLQSARGMDSFKAGLILMVYPIVLAVAAPISGSLSDKIGQRIPTFIGLCINTVGYAGAGFMTVDTSLVFVGIVFGLLGLGNALFQSPNTSLIMSSVPQDKVGVAGSMNAFVRNVGMVVGVLIATTVLFAAMSARYGQPVNDYIQGRPELFTYGMRAAYFVLAGTCFLGAVLTMLRLSGRVKRSDT